MKSEEEPSTHTDERRKDKRVSALSKIRVQVPTQDFEGSVDNASATGVLFSSEGSLKVIVELEEDGVVKRLNGHIVRAQPLKGQSTGWAIKFE
jgi:hypothetical protein